MNQDRRPVRIIANHGTMKKYNISTFMQVVRRHAPISRADISRLTGIDKKCVSMFSTELIDKGFIQEAGIESVSRGRPGYLLDFVAGKNYSVGAAVQADRVNCVLFELPNRLVASAVLPISPSASARDVAELVKKGAADMAGRVESVAGVGISFPGTMDLRKGLIHSAANLACLNRFRFREPFASLGLGRVRFEQSSRAAALAENWLGQGQITNNFANVELNVGISAVMVNNGGLYHGPDGFVGELGHVIVKPGGNKCRCGNAGCLEAYLGESALRDQLRYVGCDPDAIFPEMPAETMALPIVLSPAEPQPPADPAPHANPSLNAKAKIILKEAGVWLGRGLGPIVNLFNPESIVIHGDLMRYRDIVLPVARKEMARVCLQEKLETLDVQASRLPLPDAIGSAALAFPGWFEGEAAEYRELSPDAAEQN